MFPLPIEALIIVMIRFIVEYLTMKTLDCNFNLGLLYQFMLGQYAVIIISIIVERMAKRSW